MTKLVPFGDLYMFHGVYTAIITPFRGGKVDEKKLEELVSYQVQSGVQGIVPCGTTGESLFLSSEERERVIKICTDTCKGKAKVLAGTGALTIEESIMLTCQAEKAGADAALVINPWYVKPSQESLYLYFKTISQSTGLPLVLYNNPTRTAVEISLETILKLAELKNVIGIKDASSCLLRTAELRCALEPSFNLLSGNDDTLAAYLAMGGDGGILVASNVAPALFVNLFKSWKEGDLTAFKEGWARAFPLASALSVERIKYAMSLVHGVSVETRLPFAPLNESVKKQIGSILKMLGLWEPLRSAGTS